MSSKRMRSDQSFPPIAPPIVTASASSAAMPILIPTMPMNSALSNVHPSHMPMTWVTSDHDGILPQPPHSPFTRPGISQNASATHPENSRSRAGQIAVAQVLRGYTAFHLNTLSPSTHGSIRLPDDNLMPDESIASNGFPQRQGSGKWKNRKKHRFTLIL